MVGTLDEHVWTCTQSQHTDLGVTEIGQAGEAHFGASPHANVDVGFSQDAPKVSESIVDDDRVNVGVLPIDMRRGDDRLGSGGPRRLAQPERLVDRVRAVVDTRNHVAVQIDHEREDGSGLDLIKRCV